MSASRKVHQQNFVSKALTVDVYCNSPISSQHCSLKSKTLMYVVNEFSELSDMLIKYCFILKNTFTMQNQMIGRIALSP